MIREMLKEKQEIINHRLGELLVPDRKEHKTLYDAMNYSLLAGGKRIRPFLLLTVLEVLGKDSAPYVDAACALECIHTYSLIHDDLPAMDNDDYRRGRLTNHKVFGAGMATQAGDGLLTFAFQLLAEDPHIPEEIKPRLISIAARAAGPAGMVGGQAHDMESENRDLSLAELKILDASKTGCLLAAPVEMAAVLAGAGEEDRKALADFASHLGFLFQITDDLLDEKGNLEEMGKMPGQDEKDHKSTFVTILGADKAQHYAEEEAVKAKEALHRLSRPADVLAELVDLMVNRKK